MPSPRALVGMRVAAEKRLSEDIHALAEVMEMPEDEVPVLLVPRVPNNDPGLRHVRFLQGVCSIVERFLLHAGVDMEARRLAQEEADMADHQRPEVNMSAGPNLQPAVGDPRMTNVGQGLADPSLVPVTGVLPGMLEGTDGEVREALVSVDMVHLGLLRDMESRRLGGPRKSVLDALDDRKADIEELVEDPHAIPQEHQEVIDQQQAETEEAARVQAETESSQTPGGSGPVAMMSPNRQLAPERPPAAVRSRRSAVGPRATRKR